ncbi:uncharacterized protein LOC111043299 isoform X2 [Nilaparvata lugens]|nr:uncharacterized protein LOC111043299 isoform X2 [Nilaparvata lugens]
MAVALRLQRTYCGCSLKMGAISIGIIYLFFCGLAAFLLVLFAATGITYKLVDMAEVTNYLTFSPTEASNSQKISHNQDNSQFEENLTEKITIGLTVSAMLLLATAAFFNGMLVHGAMRNKPTCVLYWLVEQTALLFFEGLLVAFLMLNDHTISMIFVLIDIVPRIYCVLVVNGLLHTMRQDQMPRAAQWTQK